MACVAQGRVDYQIDALTDAQLTEYFSDLLSTHSWSTLKHDLYGLKFYYANVLREPWPAPDLLKPPSARRLADIVTVEQMQRIIAATKVLSYLVFFIPSIAWGCAWGKGCACKWLILMLSANCPPA